MAKGEDLQPKGSRFKSWRRILDDAMLLHYGDNKGSQTGHTKKTFKNLIFVEGNWFVKSDPGLFPICELEVLHGAVLIAAEDDVAGRVLVIVTAAGSRKRMRNFVSHFVKRQTK